MHLSQGEKKIYNMNDVCTKIKINFVKRMKTHIGKEGEREDKKLTKKKYRVFHENVNKRKS